MIKGLEKWQRWIREDLFQDIVGLFYERTMYRQYWNIVVDAPDVVRSGPQFHSWVRHNYARAVALGLRRQVDQRRDVVSLRRLMIELAAASEGVTREWYVDMAGPDEFLQKRARESFDRWGQDHVERRTVRQDIDRLVEVTSPAVQWVDSTVAHLGANRKELEISLKFTDLHEAVDVVVELYKSYSTLLTGAYPAVEQLAVDPWEHIFEVAWARAQ